MNTLFLQPTDVLFFRDGRPMSGSLAGHTAAWPLPDVTNHALHAALHRAALDNVHTHRRGRSGCYSNERDRKFGSLLTAGPFPVDALQRWFFPRPRDAQRNSSVAVTLAPIPSLTQVQDDSWNGSSLPAPLEYAAANTCQPSKDAGGEPWISADAFQEYLHGGELQSPRDGAHFLADESIADKEATLGIAIDPETQTTGLGTAAGKIYTAHYLRLREGFRLGMFAEALDKEHGKQGEKRDLLGLLFNGHPTQIVVGGQQRICTAELAPIRPLPLPRGLSAQSDFVPLPNGKVAVKWVLISPALWPQIPPMKKDGSMQNAHPGGWLPNWVFLNWDADGREANPDKRNGAVLLTAGPGLRKAQRTQSSAGSAISARLVAAIVPKPLVVTGWALPNAADPDRLAEGGAKSTHLAVPSGAVYYFEAESLESAVALAQALNWHGKRTEILRQMTPDKRLGELLDKLEEELRERDLHPLKEDLLMVAEVGGLLGQAICVRRSPLPLQAQEFARSRRISVVPKDRLLSALRNLLNPDEPASLDQLKSLAVARTRAIA
jgi:CRISPR-associated protein Cmr3